MAERGHGGLRDRRLGTLRRRSLRAHACLDVRGCRTLAGRAGGRGTAGVGLGVWPKRILLQAGDLRLNKGTPTCSECGELRAERI